MNLIPITDLTQSRQTLVRTLNDKAENPEISHVIRRRNSRPNQYVSAKIFNRDSTFEPRSKNIVVQTLKIGSGADALPQVEIAGHTVSDEAVIDRLKVSTPGAYRSNGILWPLLDLFRALAKKCGATRRVGVAGGKTETNVPFRILVKHEFQASKPLDKNRNKNYWIY